MVDTSIWVDYFHVGDDHLALLLDAVNVVVHPFVIGELSCGNLRDRAEILALLHNLPSLPVASEDQVQYFIEKQKLWGKGIGYIDVHLLAAVVSHSDNLLWTRDTRLHKIAELHGVAYLP